MSIQYPSNSRWDEDRMQLKERIPVRWNDPPLEYSMETGESKEKKREIEVTREKGWRLIFRGERRNLATITQERKEGIGMWFPTLRTFSWIGERERERQFNETGKREGRYWKPIKQRNSVGGAVHCSLTGNAI